MLTQDRAFGPVRSNRDEPEHRVEIKPAERAVVIANPQIALGQTRLHQYRQRQRNRRDDYNDPRAARVEPDQTRGRQRHLEAAAQKPAAKHGQRAQLLRAVRADGELKQLPFIMITAESRAENALAAKEAGASNYIIKPFNAETLKTKIESVLSA